MRTPRFHPQLPLRDRQMGPTGQLTPPVSRSRAEEGADRGKLAVGEVAGDEVSTR
jgi:hypothetical protein